MGRSLTAWPASRLRDPDFPALLAARNPHAIELWWAAWAIWHPAVVDLYESMTNPPPLPTGA